MNAVDKQHVYKRQAVCYRFTGSTEKSVCVEVGLNVNTGIIRWHRPTRV